MSNLPNPEDILNKWYRPLQPSDIATIEIVEAMKEYAQLVRAETLKWAKDHAKIAEADVEGNLLTTYDYFIDGETGKTISVYKPSIIEGEQSQDLHI